MTVCVAASYPTVKSTATDGCLLEGQNVSLTCQVTYSGTNLVPMVMSWFRLYTRNLRRCHHFPYDCSRRVNGTDTTNASSVHQSSLTYTATSQTAAAGVMYMCTVSFLRPTGLVLRGVGVQKQYTNANNYYYMSSPSTPRTITSKIAVCM